MRTRHRYLFAVVFALHALACAPVRTPVPPGTLPTPPPTTVEDEQYGHSILTSLRERYEVDYNHPALDRIQTIVERLTKAAGADKDPWHVYLLKDENFKNAAATRGNHVFIWTGMLDQTQSDDELAAVLAHEISHVLSGHTAPDPNEELRRILIQVGAMAAGIAVSTATRNPYISNDLGNLTSAVTNEVGSGFFLNPYSRDLEFEADRVGLLLMARAKYDPEAAIRFWDRAQANPEFSSSIPFFSTHPPAADRLANLREALPMALRAYRGEPEPVQYAQNSSAPANGRDSFDLRETESKITRPKLPDIPDAKKPEDITHWKVIGDRAVLYSGPKSSSRPVGEFRRGAVIESSSREGAWIEIRRPDQGFLREKDVVPVFESDQQSGASRP